MNIPRALTALCPMLLSLAVQAQSVEEFRHVLTVRQTGADGLQRLTLPPQVFDGATRADLGDLRVFNARGERVPFTHANLAPANEAVARRELLPVFPQWRAASAVAGESATSGGISLQVRQQADGTLISLTQTPGTPAPARRVLESYIVDASKLKSPVTALVFDWPVTPETQSLRVRIESSSDLKQWQTLVADAPLMELEHAGEKLERKRVEINAIDVRYLRLNFGGRPLELRSLAAELPAEHLAPQRVSKKVSATRGTAAGEYLFDLNGQPPVEQVSLKLAEPNSVAPARIEARAREADPWRTVTSATFYRFQREGAEIESPAVQVSSTALRHWRVLLDNRAGQAGQALPQLEVSWQPRSIVFVARGEGPYRVVWGHAEAKPDALNLAQLIPGYRSNGEYSLPEATVESLVTQEVRTPSAPERLARDVTRDLSPQKVGLWALLLGGVLLLGYMAWRLNGQLTQEAARKEAASRSAGDASGTSNVEKTG